MTNTITVLGILHAFENMNASKSLSDDDKKAVARELLANVPEEIIAPSCRNTSAAVRKVIRTYLGLPDGKPTQAKAQSASSEDASATARAEETREPSPDAVVAGPRVAGEAAKALKKPDQRSRKTHRGH